MSAIAAQITSLITQAFIQAQIKGNIKAPRHWPLWGEFTGDRWIPRTKGQLRGKCFHLMTSSWLTPTHVADTKYKPLTWHIPCGETHHNLWTLLVPEGRSWGYTRWRPLTSAQVSPRNLIAGTPNFRSARGEDRPHSTVGNNKVRTLLLWYGPLGFNTRGPIH